MRSPGAERPLPDWPQVHEELKGRGVTLFVLWEEYKAAHPEGFQHSRFCNLYRAWRGKLPVWMRQDHKAGEKLFIDSPFALSLPSGMLPPWASRRRNAVPWGVLAGNLAGFWCLRSAVQAVTHKPRSEFWRNHSGTMKQMRKQVKEEESG